MALTEAVYPKGIFLVITSTITIDLLTMVSVLVHSNIKEVHHEQGHFWRHTVAFFAVVLIFWLVSVRRKGVQNTFKGSCGSPDLQVGAG